MKAVGLIVEYNPFHNGHLYHLEAAKKMINADIVIAVMSGNFLQRGEPALVSKWQRTKMALLGGCDIVFELPYIFATQKAEVFANGAVSILDAVRCDAICFGSENGDISAFQKTITFMEDHLDEFETKIHLNMKTGVSYPKALSTAFDQLSGSNNQLNVSEPNNILGVQYLKAIKKQRSQMKAFTIKRKNANYHDEALGSETIASATSIRQALFKSSNSISQYVPESTNQLLNEYISKFGHFHYWENYWPFLRFRLLQTTPKELKEIYEVEEGIENRLISAATASTTFQEFMERVKTKRYTWTRLQRICTHILTNTKRSDMSPNLEKATYLRLLGMTQNGRNYLHKMKGHFGLPIISKLSSYKNKDIEADIRASKIYSCGPLDQHLSQTLLYQEFNQPPIYM